MRESEDNGIVGTAGTPGRAETAGAVETAGIAGIAGIAGHREQRGWLTGKGTM